MAGILDVIKRRLGRRGKEPDRDTVRYPNLVQLGRTNQLNNLVYKATPRNLRYFSRTPFVRRAMNAIKNPIKLLEWEIAPLDADQDINSELQRQIDVCETCFNTPNEADDFQSFIEAVIEDYLTGAGAVETQIGGDALRPLWMWPVDGLSIQIYPKWDGTPTTPRYAQTVGYGSEFGGGDIKWLRDDELMYLRPNPTTATPFGYGPLEIAFSSIARLLSTAEFAGNVAGNAKPSFGIDFGPISTDDLQAMKSWWRNDIEGQGLVPLFASPRAPDGKTDRVEVLKFYPEGDDGLFLKYQELLQRELCAAFDLSPQNLGIERDVNRNTSETAEDRDWDQAITPTAHVIAKTLTRHCIHNKLGFSQLQFKFVGLDREDEQATAEIMTSRYKNNSITPNEIRDRFGEEPIDSEWGDLTSADVEIALQAARGAKEITDKDLPNANPTDAADEPADGG
jgi:hypothetical protein